MIKYQCERFFREITACNFKKHTEKCNGEYFTGPHNKSKNSTGMSYKEEWLNEIEYVCPECYSKYKSKASIISHYWRSHTLKGLEFNPNKNPKNRKNGNQFTTGKYTEHSAKTRKKISLKNLENPHGIMLPENRATNGKSWKVPYIDSYGKDCLLESTWEWKMANELDKSGIKWKRPWHFNVGIGYYTPDFYLPEYDLYLDPKSRENEAQNKRIEIFREKYQKKLIIIKEYENLTWDYILSFIRNTFLK